MGSSGSVGQQTMAVIEEHSSDFELMGLSVNNNTQLLLEQVKKFAVHNVFINDEQKREEFARQNPQIKVFASNEAMVKAVDFDLLVMSLVGEIGYGPTRQAILKKKNVALATKEVLVAYGQEIMMLARQNGVEILPIDSEHSAIWQCLRAGKSQEVKKIWLTCSGGPFRDANQWPVETFSSISKDEALAHPTWNMGPKISIDSATLMNKALEVIEAIYLFDLLPEQIEVVIHPESILHSAVEFVDGSIIGQLSSTTMKIPIINALFFPDRRELKNNNFSLFDKELNFAQVDETRFPSIQLAKEAIQKNKCRAFNQANEQAVAEFLAGRIKFSDIFTQVKKSLE